MVELQGYVLHASNIVENGCLNSWFSSFYYSLASALLSPAELTIRFGSRNMHIEAHTKMMASLVYKKHVMLWEDWRRFNMANSSNILFGFSIGRCGFRPSETKVRACGFSARLSWLGFSSLLFVLCVCFMLCCSPSAVRVLFCSCYTCC